MDNPIPERRRVGPMIQFSWSNRIGTNLGMYAVTPNDGSVDGLLLLLQITHLQIMMKMDIMQKKTVEMIVMTMMQVYTL